MSSVDILAVGVAVGCHTEIVAVIELWDALCFSGPDGCVPGNVPLDQRFLQFKAADQRKVAFADM